MARDKFFHLVWPLQHNAATGGLAAHFSEVGQIFTLHEHVTNVAFITDIFFCKLDDRARFNGAPRADVMADAGGCRAQRLTVGHIIGINNGDGFLGAHLHHKLSNLELLFRSEAKLFVGIRADGAIGVIPGVHHAQINEVIQPAFLQEIINIVLAQTGGYSS